MSSLDVFYPNASWGFTLYDVYINAAEEVIQIVKENFKEDMEKMDVEELAEFLKSVFRIIMESVAEEIIGNVYYYKMAKDIKSGKIVRPARVEKVEVI